VKKRRQHQAESTTCATTLIRNIGPGDIHPEVESILRLHNESTRAQSKLELHDLCDCELRCVKRFE